MVGNKGSRRPSPFFGTKPGLSFTLMAILVTGVFSTALPMVLQKAYAVGTLEDLVITANDARTGVTTSYTITAKTDTKGKIEAVKIDFPAAYSIADCALPCGTYTLAGVSKLKSNGEFSAVAADDTITYNMSRTTAIKAGVQFSLTIEGIVNPSDAESYSITVTTLDKNGNAIDSDSDDLTISSSLSSTDADDGLTIENTGGSITIDASNDLSLEADGSTIKLDARDDATVEIEITDSVDGATGGIVTFNAALSIGTINDSVTISGLIPTLTLSDTSLGSNDDDLAMKMDGAVLTLDIDTDDAAELTLSAAGLITTASVNSASIVDNTITSDDILGDTIDDTDIVDNGLDDTSLAANSVTDSELADNAVDTAAIQAGAVTAAKLDLSAGGLTIGGGTSLTLIKARQLADGTAGWVPDGAADTFTIIDLAVTADSVIIVQADTTSACTATLNSIAAAASFTITCTNAADGGKLHYILIDPV